MTLVAKKCPHLSMHLSDWEVMEIYQSYRSGESKANLQRRYRMSGTTLNKLIRAVEDAAMKRGLI